MKCIYCGGKVVWVFPVIDGVSKCTKCDMPNSQESQELDEDQELDEEIACIDCGGHIEWIDGRSKCMKCGNWYVPQLNENKNE